MFGFALAILFFEFKKNSKSSVLDPIQSRLNLTILIQNQYNFLRFDSSLQHKNSIYKIKFAFDDRLKLIREAVTIAPINQLSENLEKCCKYLYFLR